jgi:hypothetical protein
MKILFALITLITFFLFFIEALIHFNIGKKSRNENQPQTHNFLNISNFFSIHIPDKSEFIRIFVTVLFFSTISGFSSSYIIKYVLNK